jgi:hypothetical protein
MIGVVVRPAFGRDLGPLPVLRIEPDGTFESIGLPDGDYMLGGFAQLSRDAELSRWLVASVRFEGREIAGLPLTLADADVRGVTVTFARELGAVSGLVRTSGGQVAPYARVLVFPVDPLLRTASLALPAPVRVFHAVSDRYGSYQIAHLLPGDYLVAAVPRAPESWMTPEYLQSLAPRAVHLRAGLGSRAVVNVTTVESSGEPR